mgnify:FL=1
MEKSKTFGSKKFWMILTVMLVTFILVSVVTVYRIYNYQNGQKTVYIYQTSDDITVLESNDDHSFTATKYRVDSLNDGYGRNIKAAYYGERSTMEKLLMQQAIFSAIRNCIIILFMIIVIAIVGFKIYQSKLLKVKVVNSECKAAPKPVESSECETEPESSDDSGAVNADYAEPEPEAEKEEITEPEDKENREVAESCQLP